MSVKQIQRSEIQGFSKGLVTELNPLNNQLDTTRAEQNFELKRNGVRSRRLGMDVAPDGGRGFINNISSSSMNASTVGSFIWEGAGGVYTNRFLVLQVGNQVLIYDKPSPSGFLKSFTLNISQSRQMTFGAVGGFLGIVYGSPNISLIGYNTSTKQFSLSSYRISIRDQFGIQETLEPRYETSPTFRGKLTWQHYYNLYNQSWAIPRKPWWRNNPAPIDALHYAPIRGMYPSNSDTVWLGMDRKNVKKDDPDNYPAFNPSQFSGQLGMGTLAAKGYFIIDAFNRGAGRRSAWNAHRQQFPMTGSLVGGFNPLDDQTSGGFTSIASFAGRMFYSGCSGQVVRGDTRSPDYSNYVFFSQLVKGRSDFGKCYQEGDPTSLETSDLVDTDGGFFTVSGAVNIHTMYPVGERLILLAENGVWAVSGGSGYGFSATNYKVEKISNFGGIPGRSFVEYAGGGFYWAEGGIFSIAKDQYGDLKVENISKPVIHTFFHELTIEAKQTAQAFIDTDNDQVRWIFKEGNTFKELILDLKFQAYTLNVLNIEGTGVVKILGVELGGFSTIDRNIPVTVGGIEVTITSGEVVTIGELEELKILNRIRYIVFDNNATLAHLTFCRYVNTNYEDWNYLGNNRDALAFMETNAFTAGDIAVKKQIPYIIMAFAETERVMVNEEPYQQSSCIGQFQWDFTHLARSGKWSRDLQLYRKNRFFYGDVDIDNGYTLNVTKTKVRGSGRSFALRVSTEPRKDCQIYGWNLSLTGNGT